MEPIKELNNENDFFWHKKELDVLNRYEYRHIGKPEKYPCRVASELWPSADSKDTFNHTFIYKQEVICEKCGHTQMEWPEVKL
jgi:hypothetical protein